MITFLYTLCGLQVLCASEDEAVLHRPVTTNVPRPDRHPSAVSRGTRMRYPAPPRTRTNAARAGGGYRG